MVDNERLETGKEGNIEKETRIPLIRCSDSCPVATHGQTAQLSVADVVDDRQSDAADNHADKSSFAASVDASDVLRQIVIDGSNIAMRFEFIENSFSENLIVSN